MALIFRGKSNCVLCGEIIATDHEIIATSHFVSKQDDPFWRYSDAVFHKDCFLEWEKREEFIKCFNDVMEHFVFGNGKYQCMQNDGKIIQVFTQSKC